MVDSPKLMAGEGSPQLDEASAALANWSLAWASAALGSFLLLWLPWIILSGKLAGIWMSQAVCLACLHILVASEFYAACGSWRAQERTSFWRAFLIIALNPLAGVRSGDVLSSGICVGLSERHVIQLLKQDGKLL